MGSAQAAVAEESCGGSDHSRLLLWPSLSTTCNPPIGSTRIPPLSSPLLPPSSTRQPHSAKPGLHPLSLHLAAGVFDLLWASGQLIRNSRLTALSCRCQQAEACRNVGRLPTILSSRKHQAARAAIPQVPDTHKLRSGGHRLRDCRGGGDACRARPPDRNPQRVGIYAKSEIQYLS